MRRRIRTFHAEGSPPSAQTVGRRRKSLLAAGLVDSLGLAIGWTVMSLHVVHTSGMQGLGVLAAAMLVGVACSAPFTGWLTTRLDGRGLLRFTAVCEAIGRAAAFAALFAGAPLWVVAVLVAICNVLAWTGFAGMRAEMALAGDQGNARWLSGYTACIAAAEATGAFVAAYLPVDASGLLRADVVTIVAIGFSLSLLPTFVVARHSAAPIAVTSSPIGQLRGRRTLLTGGALITLIATGPMLLAVGLADGLHGRDAIGPAMLMFAVGSLMGPGLAEWIRRLDLPISVTWSFLGILMLVGWSLAPISLIGLLFAQTISGLALGAFEGVMDAEVAERGDQTCVTGAMAWAGATRAIGSAVAVSAAPLAMAGIGVSKSAGVGTLVLVAAVIIGVFGSTIFARLRGAEPGFMASHHDLPRRWVVLLRGDAADEQVLMRRCPEATVFLADDAQMLQELATETVGPDMIMLGAFASEEDLSIVEALAADSGPWPRTFVRSTTNDQDESRPSARPRLVIAA